MEAYRYHRCSIHTYDSFTHTPQRARMEKPSGEGLFWWPTERHRSGRALVCGLIVFLTVLFVVAPEVQGAAETPAVRVEHLSPPGAVQQKMVWVSPDGSRWAYSSLRGSRTVVVVDGREVGVYSEIAPVGFRTPGEKAGNPRGYANTSGGAFTPDGELFIFVARKGADQHIVVVDRNGAQEGPAIKETGYGYVTEVVLPPAGHRYAAVYHIADPDGGQRTLTRVMVDGKDSPSFAKVESLNFSADGKHVVYTGALDIPSGTRRGLNERGYYVFIDGVPGPACGFIHEIEQYQHHALLESDEGIVAIYTAAPSPGTDAIRRLILQKADGTAMEGQENAWPQSVVVSRDRRHWACYTKRKRDYVTDVRTHGYSQTMADFDVYHNGRKISSHTAANMEALTISPDGNRTAVAMVASPGVIHPVIDGKAGADFERIDWFAFSPDGRRLAYVAQNTSTGDQYGKSIRYVVIDGQEYGPYESVNYFLFSKDSRHAAWYVKDTNRENRIILDGRAGSTGVLTRWPTPIYFHPTSGELLYVTGYDMNKPGSPEDAIVYFGLDGETQYPGYTGPQLTSDGLHLAFIGRHWEMSKSGGRRVEKEAPFFVFDGQRVPLIQPIEITRPGGPRGRHRFDPQGRFVATFSDGKPGVFSINGVEVAKLEWAAAAPWISAESASVIGGTKDGQLLRVTADMNTCTRHGAASIQAEARVREAREAAGYKAIHSFAGGNEGKAPEGPLVLRQDAVYGLAQGGEYDQGVVFRMDTDGSNYRVIHTFPGGASHPSEPTSLVYSSNGSLYGTARGLKSRGAVIFRLRTDGSDFEVVHTTKSDYRLCVAGQDGSVLGLLAPIHAKSDILAGGASSLFQLTSEGEFVILAESMPKYAAHAAQRKGEFDPSTVVGQLGPFADGGDGFFYGIADAGLYRMAYDGGSLEVIHAFEGPPLDGNWDHKLRNAAPVPLADGTLAGMAAGGKHRMGIVYRTSKDGSDYTVRHVEGQKRSRPNLLGPLAGHGTTLYVISYVAASTSPQLQLVRVGKDSIDAVHDVPRKPKSMYISADGSMIYGTDDKSVFRINIGQIQAANNGG